MEGREEFSLHASDGSDEFSGFSESEIPKKLTKGKSSKTEKANKKTGKKGSISVKKPSQCNKNNRSSDGTHRIPETSGSSGQNKENQNIIEKIDFSKLSQTDIQSLRTALGVNPVYDEDYEGDYYNEERYWACPDFSVPKQNIHVQINASDISSDEDSKASRAEISGNKRAPRARDLGNDFSKVFDDVSVTNEGTEYNHQASGDDEWGLPPVKAPERGPEVRPSLAKLINTACTVQCDTSKITNKYKIPLNCEQAVPPLINQEVWRYLDKYGHSQDKQYVDIQNLVSYGMVPIVELINLNKKNNTMTSEMKTLFSDMITIWGQVQYGISLRRRYLCRPFLKKRYSSICNMSMDITTKLFGDNLSKEVKQCENASFLGREQYQTNYRGPMRTRGYYRARRPYSQSYGNQGYNPYYQGQGRGFRPYSYPARGTSFRGNFQGGRHRFPRRRSATVTSETAQNPNEEV